MPSLIHVTGRYKAPRGGILPLMALLLVPLMGILGLVVDVSLSVGAKNDLQTKINQAALGGISNYLHYLGEGSEDCGQTPVTICAAKHGLTRAISVAKINLSLGERFTNSESEFPLSDFGQLAGAPGEEGIFLLGKYHWYPPCSDPTSNPACDKCPAGYPCFEQLENNSPDNNAVKLIAKFRDSNKIKTFFMRILGISEVGVTVEATATLLPSNHIFLMDLSRSTVQENYPNCGVKQPDQAVEAGQAGTCELGQIEHPWLWCFNRDCSLPGTRSEFIFRIDPDPSADGFAEFLTNCSSSPMHLTNQQAALTFVEGKCNHFFGWPANCPIVGGNDAPALHDILDFGVGDAAGMEGFRTVQYHNTHNRHFRIEYRCRTAKGVLPSFDLNEPPEDLIVLVDYGKPWGPILGSPSPMPDYFEVTRPTPLFDLIDAAHTGMQLLKERALAADKFGFLAFDDTFCFPDLPGSNCTFGDTAGTGTDFNGQKFSSRHLPLSPVDLTAGGNFDKFLVATNLSPEFIGDPVTAINIYQKDFISRGLFPLKGFTDIHFALQRSLHEIRKLSDDTYKVGKNSIFIFTDGLANCPYKTSTDPSNPWKFEKDGECYNDAATVVKALQSIVNPEAGHLVSNLKDSRISVSVALVGGTSGAHTLVRRAPKSNKCLDQVAAALIEGQGDDEVLVDSTIVTLEGEQYKFPYTSLENELDNFYYGAIVDPGTPFPAPNVLYTGLVKPTRGLWCPLLAPLFNPSNGNPVIFHTDLDAACAGDNSNFDDLGTPRAGVLSEDTGIPVTDSRGRLLYDPYGRSIAQQLDDCVRLSIQSPFVLAP